VVRIVQAPGGTWSLEGRAGVAPFDGTAVRVRRPPKSATYHRLAVERDAAGWSLRAYLDI
jgi:SHS2 domain-containing protein